MTRTNTAANTGPFQSLNKKVASKAKFERPRKRHTALLERLLLITSCFVAIKIPHYCSKIISCYFPLPRLGGSVWFHLMAFDGPSQNRNETT